MKFSIFSVLDHYENGARSLNALYFREPGQKKDV